MLGSLVLSRVAVHMTQIPRRPRHDRLAAASAHSEASLHLPPHTLPNLLMPHAARLQPAASTRVHSFTCSGYSHRRLGITDGGSQARLSVWSLLGSSTRLSACTSSGWHGPTRWFCQRASRLRATRTTGSPSVGRCHSGSVRTEWGRSPAPLGGAGVRSTPTSLTQALLLMHGRRQGRCVLPVLRRRYRGLDAPCGLAGVAVHDRERCAQHIRCSAPLPRLVEVVGLLRLDQRGYQLALPVDRGPTRPRRPSRPRPRPPRSRHRSPGRTAAATPGCTR